MNNRWYDADPVISNALNLIQNTDETKKNLMADLIINEAARLGIVIDKNKFDCFWSKRQDESDKFFMAVECLKAMEDEDKRQMSFKIVSAFRNMPQT